MVVHEESKSISQKPAASANFNSRSKGCRFTQPLSPAYPPSNQVDTDKLLEKTLVQDNPAARPLTGREAEILRLIVSGKTNKEIARLLCRARRTVEYHRCRLMRKLGAHTASDLTRRAIAAGLVQ